MTTKRTKTRGWRARLAWMAVLFSLPFAMLAACVGGSSPTAVPVPVAAVVETVLVEKVVTVLEVVEVEVVREVPLEVEVEVTRTVLNTVEVEVVREVPVPVEVEVTREVPVEATREVEVTRVVPQTVEVEVTREVPIEATREVEVTRIVPQTVEVEVTREVPVEATREVAVTRIVPQTVEIEVIREVEVIVGQDWRDLELCDYRKFDAEYIAERVCKYELWQRAMSDGDKVVVREVEDERIVYYVYPPEGSDVWALVDWIAEHDGGPYVNYNVELNPNSGGPYVLWRAPLSLLGPVSKRSDVAHFWGPPPIVLDN